MTILDAYQECATVCINVDCDLFPRDTGVKDTYPIALNIYGHDVTIKGPLCPIHLRERILQYKEQFQGDELDEFNRESENARMMYRSLDGIDGDDDPF